MVVLLLLRGAEDDIRAAHGRSPSVVSRLFPKVFVRVGQPLIMLVFEGVRWSTGCGIPDFPEILNEFVAGVVRSQPQERIPFVFRDDIGCVTLQPIAIILFQLLFFLAQAQPTETKY